MKADLRNSQHRADEGLAEYASAQSEIKVLQERIKALKNEAELERKTTEGLLNRLDVADKKVRGLTLENQDINKIKDERIKALIEENNTLSTTIEKFAARCIGAGAQETGNLSKKVAEVEAICAELRKDKRTVEKLEAAFKKLEEKLSGYKDEAVVLRGARADLENTVNALTRDNNNLKAEKLDLEQAIAKQNAMFAVK